MDNMNIEATDTLEGVFEARQKRSQRIRDGFISAGIKLLNEHRFDELRISDLASECGSSAGGFYSRFQDKDAFFKAVVATTAYHVKEVTNKRLSPEILAQLEPSDALDEVVDSVAAPFIGPYRGVLRETRLRILDPGDPWSPMRESAQSTLRNIHAGLGDRFPHLTRDEACTRLSFCFQVVVGVLQNELVNDAHIFSNRDNTLLPALKRLVRLHMASDPD